ncbi:hypothetical protein GXW82_31685 [Streptacidiphilus sp. 4-A2]|nr:hypothetical protein [Streptacidiphilus sp. 4-A2]
MTTDPTPAPISDPDNSSSPEALGDASPVRPGATGFWMTDRELRARLRAAVEDLVATAFWGVQDDRTLIDVIQYFAPGVCEDADLDLAYVPLVQAQPRT